MTGEIRIMKFVIAGHYKDYWHQPALEDALNILGHDVKGFGYARTEESLSARFQHRLLVGPLIRKINREFLEFALREKPDIIIFYRTLPFTDETILEIKDQLRNCVLVSYNNDNMFGPLGSKTYWRFFKKSIPLYDVNFVFRESCIANYHLLGAKNVYVLFSDYIPWLHKPLPDRHKSIDIGFYGHFENDERLDLISDLMSKLPAVYAIRGSGWRKVARNRPWESLDTTEIQNEAYVSFINNTKIALSFFSKLNQDSYTTRVFEIPACGTFLLCKRSETMKCFYEEDSEAVFFDSSEELIEKARFYLAHNELREKIAMAGHHRCVNSGYDIVSRASQMIETIKGHFQCE